MEKKERKTRYLAGFSLAIMAAGFLLSLPFQDSLWGRFLQGGFEAGLVGGLADWFAVTALFRHPLGLPIPHTALLPKNREKLTSSLVRMLEEEWLTVASIMEKIKQIDFIEKVLQIISKQIQSAAIKKGLQSIIKETVTNINIEKLTPFLETEIKNSFRAGDTKNLMKAIGNGILARNYDEAAFDFILAETGKWAAKEEAKLTLGKMGKQLIETTEADGLLKFALQSFNQLAKEEKIGQMLQTFILNRINNVSKHDNKARIIILERIRKELKELENQKSLLNDMNDWKNNLVDELELEDQLNSMLSRSKARLLVVVDQESFVDQYILPFILKFIDKMKADESRMGLIEVWLHKQVGAAITTHHSKIGILVKENLNKLDTETLIDMMENNIGKDIQWIRVNGAVCGFFIGLFLTTFKLFI